MKTFLSRWLPLLLTMAFIFAASTNSTPYQVLPTAWRQPIQIAQNSVGKAFVGHSISEHELLGKPGHILEYALLGALAVRALIWKRKQTVGLYGLAFIACELYALSDEIHQIFVPGRSYDVPDLFLDGAGIFVGLILYGLVRWWVARRAKIGV
jgi:VanZ family protein